MNTTTNSLRAIALLLALAFPAIHPPVALAQGDAIATMDTDGSNAFVNNVRQRSSVRDVRLQDGSLVRTGQRTSALLDLITQGQVQLNENSAQLVTTSFFKGARCAAVQLVAGELFINGRNVCFVTNVGAVSGISRSRINIKVDERGTVLTVIEGAADLEGKPATMLVSASEQLVVLPNGQYYKNPIAPADAERTAEWTKQYFNAQPGKKKMSKGAKVALGVLGAILAGKVIHDATDGDDHDRGGGTPQPSPDTSQPPAPAGDVPQQSPPPPPAVELSNCCVPYPNGNGEYSISTTPADCAARGGRLWNDRCATPIR